MTNMTDDTQQNDKSNECSKLGTYYEMYYKCGLNQEALTRITVKPRPSVVTTNEKKSTKLKRIFFK